jgi:hypothetical protein
VGKKLAEGNADRCSARCRGQFSPAGDACLFSEAVTASLKGTAAMLDPFADDFRPVSELLDELPIRPSTAVICRWHLRGANGTRLETLKIAGRLYTTRSELRRFLQESQRPHGASSDREGRLDAALQAAGLLDDTRSDQKAQRPRTKPSRERLSAVRKSQP